MLGSEILIFERRGSKSVKTSVKFQNKWNKTLGVAHTRYPLSIHFYCQNARKMSKFKLRKKCEKLI